jgi:hypothetical protein
MDDVVGEEVMWQVERNREWTQIHANLDDDRPGRRGRPLATRSEKQDGYRDVFGDAPNTAAKTTTLPTMRISEHSRLLAFIGGLVRQFWIFPHSLAQLVDFHVYFSYFHIV